MICWRRFWDLKERVTFNCTWGVSRTCIPILLHLDTTSTWIQCRSIFRICWNWKKQSLISISSVLVYLSFGAVTASGLGCQMIWSSNRLLSRQLNPQRVWQEAGVWKRSSGPTCADINESLQELTGARYSKQRDHKDSYEIFQYLNDYNPFMSEEGALHSIATGIAASDSCNSHEAMKVGEAILDKMEGQNSSDFVFRRMDQIEWMGLKQLIVDGKKLKVNPQLLFQRLLILANNSDYSMDDLLKYELSAQPTSLFDKHGLLHPANKPQLADALPSTPSNEGHQTSVQCPRWRFSFTDISLEKVWNIWLKGCSWTKGVLYWRHGANVKKGTLWQWTKIRNSPISCLKNSKPTVSKHCTPKVMLIFWLH